MKHKHEKAKNMEATIRQILLIANTSIDFIEIKLTQITLPENLTRTAHRTQNIHAHALTRHLY